MEKIEVNKEQYQAMCEVLQHVKGFKGTASKGRNKGNPYTLTAVNKADQFSSMLFKTAELAGCEIIDLNKDED